MLPKIAEKSCPRDMIAYHNFTREMMSRKISENNISKLKLIKQFLEDESFEPKLAPLRQRENKNSECLDRSFDIQRVTIEKTE